jgi:hypothetical protein
MNFFHTFWCSTTHATETDTAAVVQITKLLNGYIIKELTIDYSKSSEKRIYEHFDTKALEFTLNFHLIVDFHLIFSSLIHLVT